MSDLRTIRTDVVGSLLRPEAVKDARARFDEGKLDAAELRALEDQAVRDAVKLQESIGIDVITPCPISSIVSMMRTVSSALTLIQTLGSKDPAASRVAAPVHGR